jgi:membrane dipeptidase
LTEDGYALLENMAEFGFVLDLSHMDEPAALQSLDAYPHRIIASHANAKALLKGTESNRFLTDRLIQGLLERDGVIGIVPYNRFLNADWRRGDPRDGVTLDDFVTQIDYICQLAGDAGHVGFGSDADGGFGLQSSPLGMESLADLQKVAPLLAAKGYSKTDIAGIMGGNWLALLAEALPEE